MSLMDRLEKNMQGSHLPNLMIPLIVCYAAGFILGYVFPGALVYLYFDPALILRGQVWRVITFILVPNSSSIFMALITCFIYFSISRALEQVIGRFRLNFFLLSGLVLLILFGFIYYFICEAFSGIADYSGFCAMLNPYYLYGMLFVLFALMFPDAQFLFMFVFPIKGKWMVFITLGMYVLDVLQAFFSFGPAYAWIIIAMIAAAVLTLVLFLFMIRYGRSARADNIINMRSASRKYRTESAPAFRHKCCICGRTEKSNPELEFRYCTGCVGNYEYCSEHLYTHIHKKPGGTEG